MRVAFWNVNMGEGSHPVRLQTFVTWCAEMTPHVLVLEEVSATLAQDLAGLTGMVEITHAETLTRKLAPSTKQIWALQRQGLGFQGRALSIDKYPGAIRLGVKITHATLGLRIWGIHANASLSGGRNAVAAALTIVAKNPNAVVGGDFNFGFLDADARAPGRCIRCLSWEGAPLLFSQWRKEYGRLNVSPSQQANNNNNNNNNANSKTDPNNNNNNNNVDNNNADPLHLKEMGTGYNTILPNQKGVIDFVICGTKRTVIPLNNCANGRTWAAILKYFDHAPVMVVIE